MPTKLRFKLRKCEWVKLIHWKFETYYEYRRFESDALRPDARCRFRPSISIDTSALVYSYVCTRTRSSSSSALQRNMSQHTMNSVRRRAVNLVLKLHTRFAANYCQVTCSSSYSILRHKTTLTTHILVSSSQPKLTNSKLTPLPWAQIGGLGGLTGNFARRDDGRCVQQEHRIRWF